MTWLLDRRAACAGLLASGLVAAAPGPRLIPATDPALHFEGRTQVTAPGVVTIAYPGIVLRFVSEASMVALRCRSTNGDAFIEVSVDGAPPRVVRLAAGEQSVPLASGPRARRRIEILRRTAPWLSVMDIVGIETDGTVAPPPPPPSRRLLFIGDSITCGSNAEWPDLTAPEGPQHENARVTYAAELARRLNAQRHLIAYGGRGVIREWTGGRTLVNAPTFYDRALPDDPASHWDATRYVPHVIGICLGTNDFNAGIPDQAEFVTAYAEFIAKVRRDAPRAPVFVIDSPMTADSPTDGPRRTVQIAYLDEVVARCASPLVRHANIRHYPGRPGKDAHPIAEQHRAMADELDPLFRAALNG